MVQKNSLRDNVPRAKTDYPFSRPKASEPAMLLKTTATHLFEWNGKNTLQFNTAGTDGWEAQSDTGQAAFSGGIYEFAIPLQVFGDLQAGDELRLNIVVQPQNQLLPANGPAQIILPDVTPSKTILDVNDPASDDHGPGSYTYPTDSVFSSKAYDLTAFCISSDEKNFIFKFTFAGAIPNPWGSPNNLAIQTLDVYIDKDPGAGTSARMLLPGRNAALSTGSGWEYAIWAEGWTPQVVVPDAKSGDPVQLNGASLKILVDPAARTVIIRVPFSTFGDGDPLKWGYAAAVLGQEGYPSSGVWRVRDVEQKSGQWKFGGSPADTNHTRIIELIWPADKKPTQEEMLSKYSSSTNDVGALKPDDFPQIQLLKP